MWIPATSGPMITSPGRMQSRKPANRMRITTQIASTASSQKGWSTRQASVIQSPRRTVGEAGGGGAAGGREEEGGGKGGAGGSVMEPDSFQGSAPETGRSRTAPPGIGALE